MSEIIATTEIKREQGFIYFVKTGKNGCLEIHRAKAGRPKKESKKKWNLKI